MQQQTKVKPLGRKCYGSIGHLPESRMGPGDHSVPDGMGIICTTKARDQHDCIIVQEKLDGSNVGVARINGELVPLVRAGYVAWSSKYEQHHYFAVWLQRNEHRFDFLKDGFRVCGEWLAQAHGTRYELSHEPFVAFDIMLGAWRMPYGEMLKTIGGRLPMPALLNVGHPMSASLAMRLLGTHGHHGAIDPVEGVVYRVERKGEVDFLAKYVKPEKKDGIYLPEISGKPAVWHWKP